LADAVISSTKKWIHVFGNCLFRLSTGTLLARLRSFCLSRSRDRSMRDGVIFLSNWPSNESGSIFLPFTLYNPRQH
jgi:hypothetical protein